MTETPEQRIERRARALWELDRRNAARWWADFGGEPAPGWTDPWGTHQTVTNVYMAKARAIEESDAAVSP